MKVDLHLHTTASDGLVSPPELVNMAARAGLKVIAVTDHDSVEGIASALAAARGLSGLKVIPGVEISTDVPQGEIHILGYLIDCHNREFLGELKRLRNSRQVRARGMLAKLADMGINIKWEKVQEIAGDGSIGRPHVALAMLEAGYIISLKEAFLNYIGRDGPAYVEREKMTPSQAVELIIKSGGLPVLAHPADIENLEELIVELKKAGLIGIEVYYASYSEKSVTHLASLAKKYGLVATGGSDYHGFEGISDSWLSGVEVPTEYIDRLFILNEQKKTPKRQSESQ